MEIIGRWRLLNTDQRTRWFAVFVLSSLYVLSLPQLWGALGDNAGILTAVPVILAGVLLGRRAGLVTSAVLILYLMVAVALLDPLPFVVWVMNGGVLGSIATISVGVVTGWVRDLHDGAMEANTRLREEIDERHRLQRTVMRMQKMESLGRMAGGVAHDFNNLLTPILGYSELALLRLPDEAEKLRPLLSEVHRSAEHASKLAAQLLVFSRHDFAEPTRVDLNRLLVDSEPVLRSLLRKDTELTIIPRSGLGCVLADEPQLRQVLINLVLNARDAMPRGGRLLLRAEDSLTPSPRAHHFPSTLPAEIVGFSVTDTGTGMDNATMERVFDPFFTTKPQGQGTGLGLSSCFGIVSQAGGAIWVDSTVGVGTTVSVALPLAELGYEQQLQPEEAPVQLAKGEETVLVVDDEPAVRQFTASLLRDVGYKVLEAENGEDALRVVNRRNPGHIDLLLTDMVMPLMGGHELVERFSTEHPDTKVLCISGYTEEESAYPAVRAMGAEFLRKPFSASALTSKTREVLAPAA